MKKSFVVVASLALMLSLAACEKQSDAPKPADNGGIKPGSVTAMPMAAEIKHGSAVGTVTAIDTAKGMITLDHGAIAELEWPAMKMGFAIKPEQLAGIAPGDKVAFEIDWDGQKGTVTAIRKFD